MTLHTSSHAVDDSLAEEAARWCMRLHADDCTDAERAAFDRWLSSDPAHAREYQGMVEIWLVSEHLPSQATQPRSRTRLEQAPPASPRRRRSKRFVATAATLVLGLGGWLGWHQGLLPNNIQRYHASENMRIATLPDGSRAELNLGTTLWFGNFRDGRSVALREGEAYFEVRHDAEHPFVVYAGNGSITVTGTRFNVWTYGDQVVVTLTEGSVKVQSDLSEPSQVAYLSPGLQARFDDGDELPHVSSASTNALSWRAGKLVLDDLTLAEALPVINRYLDKPVRLADQKTARVRIGGIYDTRNVTQLVQTLPKVLPVYLSQNADGETVIHSR